MDNTVSVINDSTNSVIDTIKVGNGPRGVGVNINTDRIYITNYLDNTVFMIQDDIVPQTTSLLKISAQDNNESSLFGVFTTLSKYSYPIATGFIPTTFILNNEQTYTVHVGNFSKYVFDHWLDTGSTNASRTMLISSDASIVTVYRTIPQSPTGLTATVQILPIDLSWNAPTNDGGSPITGYMIERSTDSGNTWSTLVTNTGNDGTTYSDTNVLPLTTYAYRISAINSVGISSPSNTASATTPSIV